MCCKFSNFNTTACYSINMTFFINKSVRLNILKKKKLSRLTTWVQAHQCFVNSAVGLCLITHLPLSHNSSWAANEACYSASVILRFSIYVPFQRVYINVHVYTNVYTWDSGVHMSTFLGLVTLHSFSSCGCASIPTLHHHGNNSCILFYMRFITHIARRLQLLHII